MTGRHLEAMTTPKPSTIKTEFATKHAASATDEHRRLKPHMTGHNPTCGRAVLKKRRNFNSNVVTAANQNLVQLSQLVLSDK